MKKGFELLVLVVYLAMVFTLVRPGSQGPALIQAAGTVLAGVITAAAGSGGWGSSGGVPEGGTPSEGGDSGTVFA